MEIMEKPLLDMVRQVSEGVDNLQAALADRDAEITELKQMVEDLKVKHEDSLDQIKLYIKELEQIKANHAHSNDHSE
jgi:peptide subunit release factor 1 (eRF1)